MLFLKSGHETDETLPDFVTCIYIYNLPPTFLAGPVLQAGRYFYEVRIVEILDPFDAQGQSCLQVELAVVAKKWYVQEMTIKKRIRESQRW